MASTVRSRFTVRGVVQGVGFRPFVYNLARALGLRGYVLNSSDGVHIEVEGEPRAVEEFARRLDAEKPPRADITELLVESLPVVGYDRFEIRESVPREGEFVLVSPDIATCADCRRELFDPTDRRYRYPFVNCTNCGPRFTIIEDIPYDRPKTTMKAFTMCPACQAEYDDPADRRFHAQPNACPACGPSLLLLVRDEIPDARALGARPFDENLARAFSLPKGLAGWSVVPRERALEAAEELLRRGRVVGLKGLGGFHLACDARNDAVVRLLRERKRRPSKPFAVMFRDLEHVRAHCEIGDEEAALLASPAAPIVLVRKREPDGLAPSLAPGLTENGAMLPSTPLHHLLLADLGFPLVMTSGNLSEEPIAAGNAEAVERLGAVVDALLVHDRDIHSRYDDSVLRVEPSGPMFVRRARSYAPFPLAFPHAAAPPILACGPELKCTFTLTRDRYAFVSQHLGDLSDELTFEHYRRTIELYERLFKTRPELLACDLHPDYLSTAYALEREEVDELPLVRVQHHHAHIASVLGEHGRADPTIGLAFDGTGYGADGTIWGGEVLLATQREFERVARLLRMPLPGGDAAIRKPYRAAVAYLQKIYGESLPPLPFLSRVPDAEVGLIFSILDNPARAPLTSSMGRLFDVAAVLCGVGLEATYEGELAIELEALARRAFERGASAAPAAYAVEILEGTPAVLDFTPLLDALVADVLAGEDPGVVGYRFHAALADAATKAALLARERSGCSAVALSGGVWQNSLLLRLARESLAEQGFEVLAHRDLPPNDGCVSYGQAVVAAARALGGDTALG